MGVGGHNTMTHTAKHTPGPLKAVQIIIENSPCTWAVQRKSIREQWGKPSVATYIDNEADARLFAAAPAMYEALKAMLEHEGERVYSGIGTEHDSEVLEAAKQAARAALAQAEGRQL